MALYIYSRVSTLEQNYDQQLQDIKAYFASHSLSLDDVTEIVSEHESGGKSYTDRKFKQLLEKCRPGDRIFAASTDRLGRSFFDMMRLMEEAKERGVIIVACQQDISLDDDNSMAKIVLAVRSIMDEDERKRIKHRTANKKAWQREQIDQRGHFTIERGPNAGQKCSYVGLPKWADMTQPQRDALTRAQSESARSRQDAAALWLQSSQAVRYTLRKRAEGWTVTQIAAELAKLFDDAPEVYATPTGSRPSKGHVSRWLAQASPFPPVI